MDTYLKVKVYVCLEDIERDFQHFVNDWKYDSAAQRGRHFSGLVVSKADKNGRWLTVFENLFEWRSKMAAEGLSKGQISTYQNMLKNQFIFLASKYEHDYLHVY